MKVAQMANIFYLPLHVVLEGAKVPKFRVPFSRAASSKKDIFVCSIGWVSEVAKKLFEKMAEKESNRKHQSAWKKARTMQLLCVNGFLVLFRLALPSKEKLTHSHQLASCTHLRDQNTMDVLCSCCDIALPFPCDAKLHACIEANCSDLSSRPAAAA